MQELSQVLDETAPLLPRGPPVLPFLEQGVLPWLIACNAFAATATDRTPTLLFFRLFQSPYAKKCRPSFPKNSVTNQALVGEGMGEG